MLKLLQKLFNPHARKINQVRKIVEEIKSFAPQVKKLTNKELLQSTEYFRKKLEINPADFQKMDKLYHIDKEGSILTGEKSSELHERLLKILPEVYARVQEVGSRTTGYFPHFDVQLIAGYLLANNYVTEVFTGEGKTYIALLPAYLFGLTGRGVHVITVNDYLARRDGEWAGHVFNALGMTTGIVTPQFSNKVVTDQEAQDVKGEKVLPLLKTKDLSFMASLNGSNLIDITKKEAYQCDITYGQANEFGFDYLRDNMASSLEQRVQREHFVAIVDECDATLIDEARTPLIISAPKTSPGDLYYKFAELAEQLEIEKDYTVDEKARSVMLTEEGMKHAETLLGGEKIWENYLLAHHLDNALKAKVLYKLDKEYIVKDKEVLIVDQFTGRVLSGRRYSDGLHQSLEAKEKVPIKDESKTLANVTFQNYFRQYTFLAGMTGTALTESEEFSKIYNLEVIPVPTHKLIIRQDFSDIIYKTVEAKFKAVVKDIIDKHEKGQPMLVGTTSVEKSEYLSNLLKKAGVKHQVLNAKHHEEEAKIIAMAGKLKSVTIATNMAGRGTDIKLSKGVAEKGGLYVIATERHEARRIDNQLRGRSGRLGDPGASRFYVSLEDDLMRVFGGDVMKSFMNKTGVPEDIPIQSGMISKLIESSQRKVESHNFDIRKRIVEYDDVLTKQRSAVYDLRKRILILLQQETEDIKTANKLPSIDIKKLAIDELADYLDSYSLLDPYYNIKKWPREIATPLRLWILKQIFSQLQLRLAAQLLDDNQTSTAELAHIWEFVDSILPDTLQESAAKDIGYTSFSSFKEATVDLHNPKDVKIAREPILRLLTHALVVQYNSLPTEQACGDFERFIIFEPLGNIWMEHLDTMADIKEGIGLRGYGQRNPLVEYKQEGAEQFTKLFINLSNEITKRFYRVQVSTRSKIEQIKQHTTETDAEVDQIIKQATKGEMVKTRSTSKVKRNDSCPCGSGKKYKVCHWPEYD